MAAAPADVVSSDGIVVIDLRALTFMDSNGVRALMQAHRRCAQVRCARYLVPGTAPVQVLSLGTRAAEVVVSRTRDGPAGWTGPSGLAHASPRASRRAGA